MKKILILLVVLLGCNYKPKSPEYLEFYSYTREISTEPCFKESPYFIVFLVNARHLDYGNCQSFLRTLAKHPSDGSKNGDVGHAWIFLKGNNEYLEGGFSGELGIWQPRYWDGVFDNVAYGAKDPVCYLWCSQSDGFFQKGNGGHLPTFAAKVPLTKQQYEKILDFIHQYPYSEYSIIGKQCSSYVKEIAQLIGIELEDLVTLKIPQWIYFDGEYWKMWENPCYQELTFSSPDRLERSLVELVNKNKAEFALDWYFKTHHRCFKCIRKRCCENVTKFPERLWRYHKT